MDSNSNKENVPPANHDDKTFDFDKSSFKYDNERSSDESYDYSSMDDVSFFSDSITVDSSDDEHPMNHGTIESDKDGEYDY